MFYINVICSMCYCLALKCPINYISKKVSHIWNNVKKITDPVKLICSRQIFYAKMKLQHRIICMYRCFVVVFCGTIKICFTYLDIDKILCLHCFRELCDCGIIIRGHPLIFILLVLQGTLVAHRKRLLFSKEFPRALHLNSF